MGWSLGYDPNWERDVGYGVPALCDHPGCSADINRGMSYVCGADMYGGNDGCGLYFCALHLNGSSLCRRCARHQDAFDAKPDATEWINHKLTDASWAEWRREHPSEAAQLISILKERGLAPQFKTRYLFTARAESVGHQVYYVDADTKEEALDRAHSGDIDGIYEERLEVQDLEAFDLDGVQTTEVTDFGDFPPARDHTLDFTKAALYDCLIAAHPEFDSIAKKLLEKQS